MNSAAGTGCRAPGQPVYHPLEKLGKVHTQQQGTEEDGSERQTQGHKRKLPICKAPSLPQASHRRGAWHGQEAAVTWSPGLR